MGDLYTDYSKRGLYEALKKRFEISVDLEPIHDRAREIADRGAHCSRKYSRELVEDGTMMVVPTLMDCILPPAGVTRWDREVIFHEICEARMTGNRPVRVPAQLVVDCLDYWLETERRARVFSVDWADLEGKRIRILGEPPFLREFREFRDDISAAFNEVCDKEDA